MPPTRQKLAEEGFEVVRDFVPEQLIRDLKKAAEISFLKLEKYSNLRLSTNQTSVAHHVLNQSNSYLTLLKALVDFVKETQFFESKFILDTFVIVNAVKKSGTSYTQDWHIDSRRLPGWVTQHPKGKNVLLNLLVPLTEFKDETGATQYIEKSHQTKFNSNTPFESHSVKSMIGNPGDVFLFNSNLIHRAGVNSSSKNRTAIAIMFIVPWLKQQYDYSSHWNEEKFVEKWGRDIGTVVGFGSQIPSSLDEWYQPKEKRKNRGYK
jgi:ectoine hydroxylase-related dioxygenase (phytanoyl-CoA dioxygenase family)